MHDRNQILTLRIITTFLELVKYLQIDFSVLLPKLSLVLQLKYRVGFHPDLHA